MNFRESVKKILHRVTGLMITKKLPFGNNPFEDIKDQFKGYDFTLFFDIGANTGQSVKYIRKVFPLAKVWCFEPVERTYDSLVRNTVGQNVRCFRIGFGAQPLQTEIFTSQDNSGSDTHSIVNNDFKDKNLNLKEEITLEQLDNFCREHSIEKIDYVKIDTEGYDLEVLKGASRLLKNQLISFVEVEVSMNPENTYHVSFEEVKKHMERFGYRLYGIYDQIQEWPTNSPVLRRVNLLFIARKLV